MSVINKMLQDLDRRQALGAGAEAGVARPVPASRQHREWFWRIVTLLLAVGVGWVLWTAFHLLPRPLVTDLAFRAAEDARGRTAPLPERVEAPLAPATPVASLLQEAPAEEAAAAPRHTPPAAEPLKLAHELEKTPVREPAQPAPSKPQTVRAKSAPPAPARNVSVDKREREVSPMDTAEAHFRRAVLFLKHGRVSEGEDQLLAALKADPAHSASRQAYVALLLEQQRVDTARRLLHDALAIDAPQPIFALALARLYAGQRDYRAALQVLEQAGPSAQRPDFEAMRGAVLQRMGRDAEAIEAYHNALRGGPQPATTWVGLAISLEALGRKTEAADAYRKALAVGPLAAEARDYALGRARALE